MGNVVKVTIPITLDSGIDQATPRQAGRAANEPQEATTSFDSDAPSALVRGTELPVLRDEPPSSQPP